MCGSSVGTMKQSIDAFCIAWRSTRSLSEVVDCAVNVSSLTADDDDADMQSWWSSAPARVRNILFIRPKRPTAKDRTNSAMLNKHNKPIGTITMTSVKCATNRQNAASPCTFGKKEWKKGQFWRALLILQENEMAVYSDCQRKFMVESS